MQTPTAVDMKQYGSIIPHYSANANSNSIGDSRIQFLIRLPHSSCVDLTPIELEGQCSLVVNIKNIQALLRKFTTYYISNRVRFIEMPSINAGEPPLNGIVLPYLLYKYSKDFEKWKMTYDTPVFESAPKSSRVETTTKLRPNQKRVQNKQSDTTLTAWDLAEIHQRNSLSTDAKSARDPAKRKISVSSDSHAPVPSLQLPIGKDESASAAIVCNGLLPEADVFRLCNLLLKHLEVKDRKYMISVYKDAFLGRYVQLLYGKIAFKCFYAGMPLRC